nr:hypothetical protein [Nannocystis sp. ILAH1]
MGEHHQATEPGLADLDDLVVVEAAVLGPGREPLVDLVGQRLVDALGDRAVQRRPAAVAPAPPGVRGIEGRLRRVENAGAGPIQQLREASGVRPQAGRSGEEGGYIVRVRRALGLSHRSPLLQRPPRSGGENRSGRQV